METKRARILVVDDEIIIARTLQSTLTDLGYDVPAVACSAEEAFEKVGQLSPELVFMDIRLADGTDGIEAARAIHGKYETPIVFLTAYADEETVRRSKSVAPYGYLVKPVAERDLRIVADIAIARHHAERRLKKAEAELREAHHELERRVADRTLALQAKALELERSNEELKQFAYVASHDLQEPLRNIIGFLQILEERYFTNLDSGARHYAEVVIASARRMRALILDLLSYARATEGDGQEPASEIECSEVVAAVIGDLQAGVEESGAEITVYPLPKLRMNPAHLTQLLQNLIANAIKFHDKAPPVIQIGAERRDGELLFFVKDNGIGIQPEYHEKIFGVFQRLHSREEYPGTGIGLAVCRKITERYGGRIWVESGSGNGTLFWFTLPACSRPTPQLR